MVNGERALAAAYINARDVMDRLDAVAGPENWQDTYQPCENGIFLCRLSIRCGGDWVSKEDVGSPSEQPDAGDRKKAAVSDALKRAAVKWGVGRYLYSLKVQWVAYDPKKKQLVQTPKLPHHALPKKKGHTLPREEGYLGHELGKELFELCEPAGTDPAKLLAHYDAADFHLLPASSYNYLKELLTGRIADGQRQEKTQ